MANEIGKYLKTFDINKAKTVITIAIVIIIIWVLISFGGDFQAAIDSILTGLGLKKPQVQVGAENSIQSQSQTSSSPSSPWSPELFNSNPGASTLDYSTLQNLVDQIWNSQSDWALLRFSSDASQALAAIKQCNNKIDVSNLVVVFQQEHNQDLYTFMEMNYTSSANEVILSQIITFVNNLPLT